MEAERDEVVDELLVLRAREGDAAAFSALAERWHERLWRHARRLTSSADTASDVLQESWLAIARGLCRVRDPGAFRTWAFRIVTRAATGRARTRSRERGADPERFEREPAPTEGDERAEAVAWLRAGLAELSPDDRTLLSLRYLEECELAELAEILGIPTGTVKSRLFHARKRLADILERLNR